MDKTVVNTTEAPAAIGPYVQATKSGNLLFISGQLGVDPATGEMPSCVVEQAKLSCANLRAILKEAGATPANVLKTTVFLTDMANFAKVNEVYAEFFGTDVPARSCIAVAGLPKDGKVEIELIAAL